MSILVDNSIPFDELKIVHSNDIDKGRKLYNKGKLISPWLPMKRYSNECQAWMSHLEEVNSPYLLVAIDEGRHLYEIWKKKVKLIEKPKGGK